MLKDVKERRNVEEFSSLPMEETTCDFIFTENRSASSAPAFIHACWEELGKRKGCVIYLSWKRVKACVEAKMPNELVPLNFGWELYVLFGDKNPNVYLQSTQQLFYFVKKVFFGLSLGK